MKYRAILLGFPPKVGDGSRPGPDDRVTDFTVGVDRSAYVESRIQHRWTEKAPCPASASGTRRRTHHTGRDFPERARAEQEGVFGHDDSGPRTVLAAWLTIRPLRKTSASSPK